MKTKIVSLVVCSKCESEVTELWEGTDICTDCEPTLIISIDYTNRTQGYRLGQDEPFETHFTDKGKLFKHCQQEYGRCVSKCYVGDGQQIGWVFEKNVKYADCNEYYLQEAWVVVHKKLPERKTIYHYADF